MAEMRTPRRRGAVLAALLGGLAMAIVAACGGSADSSATPPDAAARAAAAMDARTLAGTRIVTAYPGPTPPPALRRMARRGEIAGVVLFAANAPSRQRARRALAALRRAARRSEGGPLLAMVDQEGGLVKRLDGAPAVSAREMGARGAAFARAEGRRTAANLRDAGLNVDLAPVLDVPRPGGDIEATDRGFSADPRRVARVGLAFAEGLRGGGVAATAKHFPGLGTARLNTDDEAQTITLPRATLRRLDEAPFRAFAAAGGEIVMLSSAIYPAFSPRPAAFSRAIATGELRGRLGFRGVAITDDLAAAAVSDFFDDGDAAALAAARAGSDLLLFTDHRAAASARAALTSALRRGALDRDEFERSAARILRLRERLR